MTPVAEAPFALDGAVTHGTRKAWAALSPCGTYRYALGRSWEADDEGEWCTRRPIFSIVMLNPSTADHEIDDPTLRRCLYFAKREGCGSLVVRNLFALRATDPKELLRTPDPIGPLNLQVLALGTFISLRVRAWGALSGRLRKLAKGSIATLRDHQNTLGVTKHGDPRHPLYLPNSARVGRWP